MNRRERLHNRRLCETRELRHGGHQQGALKTETYEKDGVTKLSLSVIADHVLALRQPARKKAGIGGKNRRNLPRLSMTQFLGEAANFLERIHTNANLSAYRTKWWVLLWMPPMKPRRQGQAGKDERKEKMSRAI
jgi:hypothetical protein